MAVKAVLNVRIERQTVSSKGKQRKTACENVVSFDKALMGEGRGKSGLVEWRSRAMLGITWLPQV